MFSYKDFVRLAHNPVPPSVVATVAGQNGEQLCRSAAALPCRGRAALPGPCSKPVAGGPRARLPGGLPAVWFRVPVTAGRKKRWGPLP